VTQFLYHSFNSRINGWSICHDSDRTHDSFWTRVKPIDDPTNLGKWSAIVAAINYIVRNEKMQSPSGSFGMANTTEFTVLSCHGRTKVQNQQETSRNVQHSLPWTETWSKWIEKVKLRSLLNSFQAPPSILSPSISPAPVWSWSYQKVDFLDLRALKKWTFGATCISPFMSSNHQR
jgi:hypothetical protein